MQLALVEEQQAKPSKAIFCFGQDVWKRVEHVQYRATARTLDHSTVSRWIDRLLDAIDWCEQNQIPPSCIIAKLDGGAVSRGYSHGYKAETTKIEYSNGDLYVGRMRARCEAYSGFPLSYLRLVPLDEHLKDRLRSLGCEEDAGMWSLPL
jgi:hypothetical protein